MIKHIKKTTEEKIENQDSAIQKQIPFRRKLLQGYTGQDIKSERPSFKSHHSVDTKGDMDVAFPYLSF